MRFTFTSASGRLENMSVGLFIRLRVWNPCSNPKYPLILNVYNNNKEKKKRSIVAECKSSNYSFESFDYLVIITYKNELVHAIWS